MGRFNGVPHVAGRIPQWFHWLGLSDPVGRAHHQNVIAFL
jgi:hypothetical protein